MNTTSMAPDAIMLVAAAAVQTINIIINVPIRATNHTLLNCS